MEVEYRLPGSSDPTLTIGRSALGGITVLAGGAKLRSHSRFSSDYAVPMPDGSTRTLRITGQWTGLKAVADGVETRLEPAIPMWASALTILPLALTAVGGLLGGLFGGMAAVVNTWVVRRPWPTAARLVAMLAVAVFAAVAWMGVSIAILPLPMVAVGTCMNGIHEGVAVTASTTRPVDCAAPHDNEVIGIVPLDDQGGYPGDAAIQAIAEEQCPQLFADYVGVTFDASSLAMLIVGPNQLSWAKGDHLVACVVLAADGSRLTGSVRGAGQ